MWSVLFWHWDATQEWRGWRLGVVALAAGAALAGCGGTVTGSGLGSSAGHGSGSPTACVADSTTVNGIATRGFCGKASAQVIVAGASITWQHGECDTADGNFAVNFGRQILGSGTAAEALQRTYDYFGIAVTGAGQDGIYTQNGAIVLDYHGTGYTLVNYTVSLTNLRTQGTFGGTDVASNQPISGTFACG